MGDQGYEIPDNRYNRKNMETAETGSATKTELQKFKRLVYIETGILVLAVCVAVMALALSLSKNDDHSSGQTSDACSSAPCTNQGTCIGVPPDNYVCSCVATYYGRNCELGGMKATIFLATSKSKDSSVAQGTIIRWDDERFDPGNNFDISTGAYIAPADGYYQFSVSKRAFGENAGFVFLVDGVWNTYCFERDPNYAQATCDIVLKLRSGERVQIHNYHGSTIENFGPVGELYSWFSGYMLYPL